MTPEHAKAIAEYFAAMMETEGKTTTKVLNAIPNDRRDYKPDEKSRSAWELATHLATADLWFIDSICDGTFVWDPDGEKKAMTTLQTTGDVVEFYKREFPKRIDRLRTTPGEQLAKDVDFFGMMKQPAIMFLGMANNHGIHHRGQLAAYLRAMGSKVPSLYGGSADEPFQAEAAQA
jgi:uncharacterized damage-inducible protein DinB